MSHRAPLGKETFTFKASVMQATHANAHGTVKVVDGRNFPASKKIAAAIVTVKPGGMREMHWHPNASEWQFWMKGQGRMTVFNAQGRRADDGLPCERCGVCAEDGGPLH